ncbi:uncharacterized protein [Ptychodera flava]|uniref:uncharacterized protein n=1 Tax=Ptychodera flava TaxID=63121 RepID=UPI00396A9139
MKSLLFVFTVCVLYGGVQALTCYDCTSVFVDNCRVIDANTSQSNCSSGESCRVLTTYLADAITSVLRDCESSCSAADVRLLGTGAVTTCCSDADLCNGSGRVTLETSMVVLMIVSIMAALTAISG